MTDEEILSQINEAISHKQDTVKFYFMIGLPTETDEDILGIAELMKKIKSLLKDGRKRKLNINISLSPFVPKPHTPFQWAGQISIDEIQRKVFLIKDALKPFNIKISWHDPKKVSWKPFLQEGISGLATSSGVPGKREHGLRNG